MGQAPNPIPLSRVKSCANLSSEKPLSKPKHRALDRGQLPPKNNPVVVWFFCHVSSSPRLVLSFGGLGRRSFPGFRCWVGSLCRVSVSPGVCLSVGFVLGVPPLGSLVLGLGLPALASSLLCWGCLSVVVRSVRLPGCGSRLGALGCCLGSVLCGG